MKNTNSLYLRDILLGIKPDEFPRTTAINQAMPTKIVKPDCKGKSNDFNHNDRFCGVF